MSTASAFLSVFRLTSSPELVPRHFISYVSFIGGVADSSLGASGLLPSGRSPPFVGQHYLLLYFDDLIPGFVALHHLWKFSQIHSTLPVSLGECMLAWMLGLDIYSPVSSPHIYWGLVSIGPIGAPTHRRCPGTLR